MVGVVVAVVVSFLVAGPIATTRADAQPYTWTDESGVTHYTADPRAIPPEHRPADLPSSLADPAAAEPAPEGTSAPETPSAPATAAERPVESAATPDGPRPAGSVMQFSPGAPIVVSARLNGVPMALLLDTGADRTLLSPGAVARAGYAGMIVPSGSGVRILGVTGSADAALVTVPLLDIAGTRIGPLSLIVHDAGLGDLDGLLGRDVLDAFTLTIDASAGRATLTPR